MSENQYVGTVTTENFVEAVIQRSQTTPVLVDFWADWCEPCKSLMPVLSALAEAYDGAFYLAKVNADEEQAIVAQAQIRSLPTVMLFINGQVVDQFMGAKSEGEVRAFLDKHIQAPAPTEHSPLEQAQALIDAGQDDQAYALLQAAQAEDPTNPDILIKMAGIALSKGDTDAVSTMLGVLPQEAKSRADAKQIEALLNFAKANDPALALAELATAFEAEQLSPTHIYQLGVKQALNRDFAAASDAFFHLLSHGQAASDQQSAREALIALFNVMEGDPLVAKLRRRMFALLH